MSAFPVQRTSSAVMGTTRLYQHIVQSLEAGEYLRLMVQASAGTGKSFLLSSVYLFCIVHGFRCKAAAPTGIAAANIEIPRTDVSATTLHALFEELVFIVCLSQHVGRKN